MENLDHKVLGGEGGVNHLPYHRNVNISIYFVFTDPFMNKSKGGNY